MSAASRDRLVLLLRDPDCDLAEAALLCCVEVEPDLDVEVELLRLDAIADGLVSRGFVPRDPAHDAAALSAWLGGELGFAGDPATYHDPRNGLLTVVLDTKRGLPITLSIVYTAIARRLRVPAFGIGLPGHFVTGIGTPEQHVVVDPFHAGLIVDEEQLDARVRAATGGLAQLEPAMLRPSPPAAVVRRLLNNLTRDFLGQDDVEDALWTLELKELVPGSTPEDTRLRGELLIRLGRYRDAAVALESYVEEAPASEDTAATARLALRARAKMN